jgi:hypothetical protein
MVCQELVLFRIWFVQALAYSQLVCPELVCPELVCQELVLLFRSWFVQALAYWQLMCPGAGVSRSWSVKELANPWV